MVELHLAVVFLSALSLSLGHCVGMCGGIVIAYANISKHQSYMLIAHGLYNLGRWISYVLIGIVFAILGRGVALSSFLRESMHIIIGALLILYAFGLLFFPKILRLLEPNVAKLSFFSHLFARSFYISSLVKYLFIGILNGFLPCGLVYFFALSTLNTTNLNIHPILAAVCIMSTFWLATLAPILGVGALSSFLRTYQQYFLWVSFVLMIIFGLLNIYQGINIMKPINNHKWEVRR